MRKIVLLVLLVMLSFTKNVEVKATTPADLFGGYIPVPVDTDSDGYLQIHYIEQLYYINYHLDEDFELWATLDFDSTSSYYCESNYCPSVDWNGDGSPGSPMLEFTTGRGWMPIGEGASFSGRFNGNSYSINNLLVNANGLQKSYVGLFARVIRDYYSSSGYAIENLIINDARVANENDATGFYYYTGVLAAHCTKYNSSKPCQFNNIQIKNSRIDVKGDTNFAGGIVGYLSDYSAISNSSVTDMFMYAYYNGTSYSHIGGIAGSAANDSSISQVFSHVKVRQYNDDIDYIGGVVGNASGVNISDVIAYLDINTYSSRVGGITATGHSEINRVLVLGSITTTQTSSNFYISGLDNSGNDYANHENSLVLTNGLYGPSNITVYPVTRSNSNYNYSNIYYWDSIRSNNGLTPNSLDKTVTSDQFQSSSFMSSVLSVGDSSWTYYDDGRMPQLRYGNTTSLLSNQKTYVYNPASNTIVESTLNTLTFNSNGGSSVSSQSRYSYTLLTEPTAPTKNDYVFEGWYTDSNLTNKVDFSTYRMPNATTTLYANWDLAGYSIAFNSNTGDSGSMSDQTILIGESGNLTSNAFTKIGYTFNGWNTAADGSGTSYSDGVSITPSSDMTLYAQWTAIPYNLSFDENGGDSVTDMTGVTYGYQFTSFISSSRTGYSFDGWFLDEDVWSNAVSFPFSMPASDTTIYAKWTANNYTITLDKVEGTGGTDSLTMTYDELYPASLTPPTKEGHTFTGYNSSPTGIYTDTYDKDGNVTDVNGQQRVWSGTKDYTWYAQWDINQYTIDFVENGGSIVDTITQDYGTDVAAPTNPSMEGHNFGGWYSDSNLTNAYTFTTVPASNTTLYAKWNVGTYSLTFNENGGSDIPDSNEVYNTSITKPSDPTKPGYTFKGWYSDIDFSAEQTFPFNMPGDNKIVYAKWEANTYRVTFNANNGSGLTSNQDIVFDSPANLTANPYEKIGYDFAGWNTSQDGSGTNYNDEALYTITDNVNLYATWTVGTYTISFEENGGSEVVDIGGNYNDVVTEPEEPTKSNHTFLGWFVDSNLTTEYIFNTIPSSDITIYAKWKQTSRSIPLVRTLNLEVEEEITVEVGCDYDIEFIGYELYGYYKVDLTNNVKVTGYVDTHKPGTYPITLELEYNERTIIKEVNVKVIDVKPPVITNSTGVLYYGREHELDFTATDDCLDVELEVESYNNGLVKYVTVTATDMSGNQTVEQYELPIVFAENHIKTVKVLDNQLIYVFNEADYDIDSLELEVIINDETQKLEITIKDKNNNRITKEVSFYEVPIDLNYEIEDFSFSTSDEISN